MFTSNRNPSTISEYAEKVVVHLIGMLPRKFSESYFIAIFN